MKRKTSSAPTRIWSFGCRAPTSGVAVFREQLRLAHQYHNELVAIERDRLRQYRELRSASAPELCRLENLNQDLLLQKETAREELQKLRQKDRKRTAYPEAQAAITALGAAQKEVSAAMKIERKRYSDAGENSVSLARRAGCREETVAFRRNTGYAATGSERTLSP